VRRIVWLVVIAACSSHPGEPSRPHGSAATQDPRVAPASPPSEHECEELIAHAVAIGIAELRATRPANQLPTEAEQTSLAVDLRTQWLAGCLTLTPHDYRCAVTATTLAGLTGCQTTPSSSTSNNSVAPGGMSPPAPRAP